jgi:hypothetical protein
MRTVSFIAAGITLLFAKKFFRRRTMPEGAENVFEPFKISN